MISGRCGASSAALRICSKAAEVLPPVVAQVFSACAAVTSASVLAAAAAGAFDDGLFCVGAPPQAVNNKAPGKTNAKANSDGHDRVGLFLDARFIGGS